MAWDPSERSQIPQIYLAGMASLGHGLDAIGEDIGKHIAEQKKLQEEQTFNDQIVQHAMKPSPITGKPAMSLEDYQKYQKGSASAKNGIVHGLMVDMADDFKQQYAQDKLQSTKDIAQARADASAARTEAETYKTYLQFGQPAGNAPTLSPDKTMYLRGNKWFPVTDAMTNAGLANQPAAKPAQQPPGWWSSHAPAFLGGGTVTPIRPQPAAPTATTTPAPSPKPVMVKSIAEAQKLAPGTPYVTPDGTPYVR